MPIRPVGYHVDMRLTRVCSEVALNVLVEEGNLRIEFFSHEVSKHSVHA